MDDVDNWYLQALYYADLEQYWLKTKPKYNPYEVFKPTKKELKVTIADLKAQVEGCNRVLSVLRRDRDILWGFWKMHQNWLISRIEHLRFRVSPPKNNNLDIETAKKVPITAIYEGRLRKVAGKLIGKCPFHSEKTGSFVIYIQQNRWHCFGACSEGGDSIDFVQKKYNLTFKDAANFLHLQRN